MISVQYICLGFVMIKFKMNTSMITALAAGLVSISALSVSIYEAYLQRQEQRISVWPILEHWTSFSDDEFSIFVANKGIGPAVIHDLKVLVKGIEMQSWNDVFFPTLGDDANRFSQSLLIGNVMSPGDASPIVSYSRAASAAWQTSKDITIYICYCSVFNDCWKYQVYDLVAGRPAREPISSCVDIPSGDF